MVLFRVRNSTFFHNVATLFSGKVFAALISLALVPIVARLFDPADFGVAAVFLAIIVTLGSLSTACFDMAIVLPKSDVEANKITKLSLMVLGSFVLFLLFFLIIVNLSDIVVPFLDQIGVYSWLLPVAIFLFGIISILENWLTRKKAYSLIATSDVAQSAVMPVTRIGLGLLYGSSVSALITGYLLGAFSKISYMLKSILSKKELMVKNKQIEIKELIYEYSDFPLYSAPSRFLRSLSKTLLVLMLGYMFSPVIAGFYAMADRLVRMPTEAASMSVRRVYIQKVSEYKNENISLETIFVKITLVLLIVGLLPFSILWFNGEEIVGFVLGERWLKAGHFSEILAPWFYSIWVVIPSSALFVVYRRQKLWLSIQVFLSIMLAGVCLIAYLLKLNTDQTLQWFVVTSVIVNIFVIYIVYKLVLNESTDL